MEAIEEQLTINIEGIETTGLNSNYKNHNPGLKALLAIKNFTATLEKDFTQLHQMENDLSELNKNGLLMIETTTSQEAIDQWMSVIQQENNALTGINNNLTKAKLNLEQKAKDVNPEWWIELSDFISALQVSSKNAGNEGLDLLPQAIHPQWINEFSNHKTPLVQSIVSKVESCRVMLQMIERYTPDELNNLTQIIVNHIPLDFTYEEAVEYQNDYYKALINFRKEFKKEKNLWDKFLDILAGGTHQSPSERVMMERWLDGEKGDL